MAIVLGVNAGFVTESPVDDPGANNTTIDFEAWVIHDISPAGVVKITEIGWYCDNATQETNFEVGLYAADGEVVPGEAGTLLYSDITNAKGTTAGWKTVAVDWEISASTDYWIAVQVDNTSTVTLSDSEETGGSGTDEIGFVFPQELPDPFGGGNFLAEGIKAIYAVWEGEAPVGTNMQVQVDDVLRPVDEIYVQKDDVFRPAEAYVNKDDVWRA